MSEHEQTQPIPVQTLAEVAAEWLAELAGPRADETEAA